MASFKVSDAARRSTRTLDVGSMALSEFEAARVRRALDVFLEKRRPPPHIRPKLDLGYRISGQSVEIFEIRPVWRGPPGEKLERGVAKATFVRSKAIWRVFWLRRDLKWDQHLLSKPLTRSSRWCQLMRMRASSDRSSPCGPVPPLNAGVIRRRKAHRVISRRSVVFVTSCGLLCLTVAHAHQFLLDWLIVPGERVGPITATTSEELLETFFGPGNVEPIDVYVGEGFTEPGAVVYPDDATRRIEVVWKDDARTAPKEVRLTGNSTKWRTREGISLGSTLKEIERLNGWPFRLVGFAFDYGGTITGCDRGRLSMLGCIDRDGASQARLVVLRLAPSYEARTMPEYHQVVGDKDFSSGHPAMQTLNPSVYQIIVSLSQ